MSKLPTSGECYLCYDCDTLTTKPFDNGDGHIRCEKCAVEKYKNTAGYRLHPIFEEAYKAELERLLKS